MTFSFIRSSFLVCVLLSDSEKDRCGVFFVSSYLLSHRPLHDVFLVLRGLADDLEGRNATVSRLSKILKHA